jgi:cobalt-zinc-cadmium efflux system outer membrane protein
MSGVVIRAAIVIHLLTAVASAQVPSGSIDPAGGMTIDQAVAEALRAEPLLAAARADAAAARGDARQAALRSNPDVMFEQREQAGGSDRQTAISIEFPLDLFRRGARIETAHRVMSAADAAIGERERQIATGVREQYGRVVEAVRRVEIADAVLAASRRTYELLRARVDEGAAPPIERDAALLDLRRMESARELAVGRVGMAAAAMNRLLGREAATPVILGSTLEALAMSAASPAPAPAAGARADVREAMAMAAVARARTREARQDGKPELALFGGYMRMDSGFEQLGFSPAGTLAPIQGRFHNIAGGIRFSIPIFNRAQGAVASARAKEIAANEVVRAKHLEAESDFSAAAARVEAARRAVAAYSPEVRALASRNLDVLRETHALGRATLFDVLNEQRRYLEFESSYADALIEVFAAEVALRSARGDVR